MMPVRNEIEWLRDRGVQVDRKGRIIVSLPAIPDDEINVEIEGREPSIAELMRHEINPRRGGSHGRPRRRLSTPVQSNQRAASSKPTPAVRLGRPTIGSETRIRVQTMIAQRTRDLLRTNNVTLADIFDQYARKLLYGT